MSSKKNRSSISAKGAPETIRGGASLFLNKIWELSGYDDTEAVAGTPFSSSQFGEWRRGLHKPNKAALAVLGAKFKTKMVDLLEGRVSDEGASYVKKVSDDTKRILSRVEHLMEMKDKKIIASLEGHLDLLEEIAEHRRKKIIRENPPTGQIPPQESEALEYEFREDG